MQHRSLHSKNLFGIAYYLIMLMCCEQCHGFTSTCFRCSHFFNVNVMLQKSLQNTHSVDVFRQNNNLVILLNCRILKLQDQNNSFNLVVPCNNGLVISRLSHSTSTVVVLFVHYFWKQKTNLKDPEHLYNCH